LYVNWIETPSSQRLDKILINSTLVWNVSDPNAPSDIPTEGNWLTDSPSISGGITNFSILFGDDLQTSGYEVRIVFNIGCQVVASN